MKLFKLAFATLLILSNFLAHASGKRIGFDEESNQFTLENDLFKRTIQIIGEEELIKTTSYMEKATGHEFIRPGGNEFHFAIDEMLVTGTGSGRQFTFSDHKIIDEPTSSLLKLDFEGSASTPMEGLEFSLFYEIYDDVAVVRKWLEVFNGKSDRISINQLAIESLVLDPQDGVNTWVYGDFCRYAYKMPYHGRKNDPAVLIQGGKGIVIAGNESPGILKYTGIGVGEANLITIGMTTPGDPYPFRYNLEKGGTFTSPKTFILVSESKNREIVLDNELDKFIRNHLGVKLFNRTEKPHFLYNTWNPFRTGIDENLIRKVADALENTGVEYLIVDDGWQDNYGDWNAHPKNFSGGIKPALDYIRKKGMTPGLWISPFTSHTYSQAFKDCADCAVTDDQGKPTNLHGHSAGGLDIYTMDILSPWYDHMLKVLDRLVGEWGAEYLKLDLALVKSAYVMDTKHSGSYTNTGDYQGREDYLYKAYERMLEMFDTLSKRYPKLVIDCTYEIWGDHHSIDYALIKHADVDWISNFFRDPPQGSRDVRWLAWHHGGCMPTSPMMIGNQQMDAANHRFSFLSNFASIPMMLGDPRNLDNEEKAWYKNQSAWLRKMDESYDILKYYQTSGTLGQPSEDNWDGFIRFNQEKDGGIFCVFRNASPDRKRQLTIPYVNEYNDYRIIDSEQLNDELILSGKKIISEGIPVKIATRNSGRAFEIRTVDK